VLVLEEARMIVPGVQALLGFQIAPPRPCATP